MLFTLTQAQFNSVRPPSTTGDTFVYAIKPRGNTIVAWTSIHTAHLFVISNATEASFTASQPSAVKIGDIST